MNTAYSGATRQTMERAGRALPKRQYRCPTCGPIPHDQGYRCQMGYHTSITTVKSPR